MQRDNVYPVVDLENLIGESQNVIDSNEYSMLTSELNYVESCKDMQKFFDYFVHEITKMGLNHNKANKIFQLTGDLLLQFKLFSCRLIEDENGMSAVEALDAATTFVSGKVSEYQSSYKRKKKNTQNECYVASHEMALGLRWDLVREHKTLSSSLRLLQCKMQYIPMIESISALFKRKDFRDAYFEYNSQSNQNMDVYSTFSSGKIFQNNELFRAHPNSLQIQIATDDFEVANPLGSKATLHKVCAFYFSIRNVPEKFRSRLDNIYLLLLCNSDDLKTKFTDINDVLRPIVRELKYLEETGLSIDPDTHLYGTLVNLSFDNLGGNLTLGLSESFSTLSPYCRICVSTQAECKRSCVEMESKIRNKEMYNQQIEKVIDSEKMSLMDTQGIKRYCVLNELKYFHTFENFSVDIMHDLNEGCIPFLLGHLFKFCIKSKLISEENLVQKFQFYDYGYLNQDHRPSTINLSKKNLNQNASQSKCLFLHVPFVLFNEQNDTKLKEIWNCVETLLVITQISYSLKFHDSDLRVLKEKIKLHLECIRNYFNVDLIPKHHFLLHYVRIICLMGNLKSMSMMRYESKHKSLKQIAKIGNNFKNITKTMVTMHQQTTITNKESYMDVFSNGLKTVLPKNFIDLNESMLIDRFNLNENLFELKWFSYFEFKYKCGLFIFVDNILCEITRILNQAKDFYFIIKEFKVVSFSKCLNSANIEPKNPSIERIVQFSELEHKQVYEKKTVNNCYYIIIDSLETQRCMNLQFE